MVERFESELEADEPDGVESAQSIDGEGDALDEATLEELAAIADVEAAADGDQVASLREALEAQRTEARRAVERYREAVLAAEPALPQELVHGETIEALEQSLGEARAAVAQIRDRLGAEQEASERGFPVGSPARGGDLAAGLSVAEKIRVGLEQRARGG